MSNIVREIPGVARKPQGFTRHVAYLAGARYWRSRRNVPIASLNERSACYFGYSHYWALFDEEGDRVGRARSPIKAALFLKGCYEPSIDESQTD